MTRAILAAFLGFVVMSLISFALITALWFMLGSDFAFKQGTTSTSDSWALLLLGVGLVGAIAGGCTAAMVGGFHSGKAVNFLLGLNLALGIFAIAGWFLLEPASLPGDTSIDELTFVEAGQYARPPIWYNPAVVVIGLIGIYIGGTYLAKRSIAAHDKLDLENRVD